MTTAPPRAHSVRQLARPSQPVGGSRWRDTAWRLAESLASPLVPSDYLDLFDPLRAGADLRGRIVDLQQETADAVTVVVRPGRGWRGHVPGQYIRIGVDIAGVRHWRAYSVTSRNGASDGLISFTTKVIPGGRVSTYLVRAAQPGQLIMLDQATGDFTLDARETGTGKTLFLTAGSGITPVMGMLRNHLGTDRLRDVVHLHVAPTSADVIFGAELRGYAASGAMTLIERHDDTHGILDLAALDSLVPDWRERDTFACGPAGLLDAAEERWLANDVLERLHVERFRPTLIEPGEGGEITFLTSDISVDADGSTPILDAGEDAGVLMPSGCRMGICMGCVVTMRQGAVRDLRTGEITIAEPGDELPVQTCINAVAGSCDLEL